MRVALSDGTAVEIDDADQELFSQLRWHRQPARHTTYVSATRNKRTVYLHRFLLGEPSLFVDHINGDGLDNRRQNLRLATRSENARNSTKRKSMSRFRGVAFHAASGCWMAQIHLPGGQILARYDKTEIGAAEKYNSLAIEHFGAFARLNDMAAS